MFSSIGPILISRFILGLRRASLRMAVTTSTAPQASVTDQAASSTSALEFASSTVGESVTPVMLLSLGSSLDEDLSTQWDELAVSYGEIGGDGSYDESTRARPAA